MKNIISYYGIGSGADVPNRNIGWGIPRHGWQQFVDTLIKPQIDLGITRFQIHNPGGTLPNEIMQADQFVEAKDAGLTWVYKDFVKAWRPITEKYEVIAYLGTLPEEDFLRLQSSKFTLDTWMQRLVDSYRYPIDAGMTIAFDAMHHNLSTSPEYHFMRMLQGLGIKTWIEPWPSISYPHFWDCNNQSTVSLYHHMIYRDSSWAAPKESLTGEIAIILNNPPAWWQEYVPTRDETKTWQNYDDWGPAWCNEMTALGFTSIVSLFQLIEQHKRLEDWLKPTV